MHIRRVKPRTAPRVTSVQSDDTLARWLAEADMARADPTGRRYWSIYTSPVFAEVWYAARDAGERTRAEALVTLYKQRAQPGGAHPDPRGPAAFSERAILSTVARRLGLQIWQHPAAEQAESGGPTVWLMTYPREENVTPTIFLHQETKRITEPRILFELACMIGFISREEGRMLDPEAPHGATLLPTDPGALVLMHHFAKALLCRSNGCPPELGCSCELIWQRFNAPPPDHEQSTDTLDREEILRRTPLAQRDRQDGKGT